MTNFLTNDQLVARAPSVFAESPAANVSDKYAFVPTTQILNTLEAAGWLPVRAQESRVRLNDKQGYQRHMVRLRHQDANDMKVGDSLPEIVLTNSHDGLASFCLTLGLFRLVCSNGMVVSEGMFESARIKHTGYRDQDIIDITGRVVQSAPLLTNSIGEFESIQLSAGEQLAFAKNALDLRWNEGEAPIDPSALLRIRRRADDNQSLWATLNVVQENLLKGGLRGRSESGRRTSTREVTSVTEDIRLNKALWSMAQGFVSAKVAA